MADLGLTSFNKLYPMLVKKYKNLSIDQNADITDKINQIVNQLNALGKLSNDVVRDWNTVYNWVMNDGLTQAVQVNNSSIQSEIGDLTTLETSVKDSLVHAINSLFDQVDFLPVLTDVSQLPTPSINYRFKRYAVLGDSGIADSLFVCKMLNDGTFDWIQYA